MFKYYSNDGNNDLSFVMLYKKMYSLIYFYTICQCLNSAHTIFFYIRLQVLTHYNWYYNVGVSVGFQSFYILWQVAIQSLIEHKIQNGIT